MPSTTETSICSTEHLAPRYLIFGMHVIFFKVLFLFKKKNKTFFSDYKENSSNLFSINYESSKSHNQSNYHGHDSFLGLS